MKALKMIIKLILALVILAGAIFVPNYRMILNPLVALIVGFYFGNNKEMLVSGARRVLDVKAE